MRRWRLMQPLPLFLVCARTVSVTLSALVIDYRMLSCKNQTTDIPSTCDNLLQDFLPTDSCEAVTNSPCQHFDNVDVDDRYFFSRDIDIDNTQLLQPSITLEVNSSSRYRKFHDNAIVNAEGYVIGYRDCSGHSGELCYIYVNTLPFGNNDWTHMITPPSDSRGLSVGDECTFFGCLQYCLFNPCLKVRTDFLEESVTILATCPDLGNVENGNLNITSPQAPTEGGYHVEGTVVKVSCDEGYTASNGDESFCQQNRTWSNLLTCSIIDCGEPRVHNASPNHEGQFATTYNSRAFYKCNPKYTLSIHSSGNLTCLKDGNWSEDVICLATCPNVSGSVENGNISIDSPQTPTEAGHYVEGTVFTVICMEGYTASNGDESVCLQNGTWSTLLNCTITCHDLESVDNGNLSIFSPRASTKGGHYVEGTVARVTCDEGYIARNGDESICQQNGSWSYLLYCTRNDGKMSVLLITLISILLICVAVMAFCIVLFHRRGHRNDKIQKLNSIFARQANRELLDPKYCPVDVFPHTKLSVSLSNDYCIPLTKVNTVSNVSSRMPERIAYHPDNEAPSLQRTTMNEFTETKTDVTMDVDTTSQSVDTAYEHSSQFTNLKSATVSEENGIPIYDTEYLTTDEVAMKMEGDRTLNRTHIPPSPKGIANSESSAGYICESGETLSSPLQYDDGITDPHVLTESHQSHAGINSFDNASPILSGYIEEF